MAGPVPILAKSRPAILNMFDPISRPQLIQTRLKVVYLCAELRQSFGKTLLNHMERAGGVSGHGKFYGRQPERIMTFRVALYAAVLQ